MFKKSVKSSIAICAVAFVLPQVASAAHAEYYYHNHGAHHQRMNRDHVVVTSDHVVVTMKTGNAVTMKNGNAITTKWSRKDVSCGPSMSHPYYVFFANNSTELSDDAKAVIREAYESALMNHAIKFKLSGHASTAGNAHYNMKLSARRAAAVEKELQKLGAGDSKITTAAFGETVPYNRETRSPSSRQDRRVELRYVYKK